MRLEVDIEKRLQAGARRFDLQVAWRSDADVLVLFGPSGAGKSVSLLCIAGLLRPDRGRIACADQVVFDSRTRIDVPARRRGTGFVFQDYALFPHLNVAQNVGFARGAAPRKADATVQRLLEEFDIAALSASYPEELSGGQRQRVALARALAAEPRLLLLDEPFAALDAPLRVRMRTELARARQRHGVPLLLITHDPEDVVAFDAQVLHIEAGRVVRG